MHGKIFRDPQKIPPYGDVILYFSHGFVSVLIVHIHKGKSERDTFSSDERDIYQPLCSDDCTKQTWCSLPGTMGMFHVPQILM